MKTNNYQELIEERIFIGGADDALEAVKNEDIDIVIDLRAETPNEVDSYNRKHRPIVDDQDQQDHSIREAVTEVVTAYKEGKKVFFHCGGGSNRTGTVAIGLLLELGIAKTLKEAEERAMTIREKIKVKPEMKEAIKRIYINS